MMTPLSRQECRELLGGSPHSFLRGFPLPKTPNVESCRDPAVVCSGRRVVPRPCCGLFWVVLGNRVSVACFVVWLLAFLVTVRCLQDALIALIGVPPEPPVVTAIDGSRIVVKIAGTTPAPALLAVEGVEVQQECGTVTVVVSTAADVTLARTAPSDRLRLRWLKDGVRGPWSDWVPVVRGGRRERQLPWHLCCAEWGGVGRVCSLCMMSVSLFLFVSVCPATQICEGSGCVYVRTPWWVRMHRFQSCFCSSRAVHTPLRQRWHACSPLVVHAPPLLVCVIRWHHWRCLAEWAWTPWCRCPP